MLADRNSTVLTATDGTAAAGMTVEPEAVGCVVCVAHDDEW